LDGTYRILGIAIVLQCYLTLGIVSILATAKTDATTSRTRSTSRLTLKMPEAVRKQMEHVTDQTHAQSLTEVIRRALAVYGLLRKAAAAGSQIVIKTKTGSERELVIAEFG
jgi:hypothetical protein